MTSTTCRRSFLRLLPLACLGVALGGLASCRSDCGTWSEPEPLELGVSEDLHAIATDPSWNGEGGLPFYAVGADGLIVEVRDEIRTHRPVAVDLHGVTVSRNLVIAVGDAGTVVRAPLDGSEDWQVIDVGVKEDLYAFIPSVEFDLVLGDGVLLVHDPLADTWTRARPPLPGWGSLRAGFRLSQDGSYYVVGLGGAAWTTFDPLGDWERVDLETDADLLAGRAGDAFIVGRGGTLRRYLGDEWKVWDTDADVDFIASAGLGLLLTADGRLLGTSSVASKELHLVQALDPGMTALAGGDDGEEPGTSTLIVVGTGGRAVRLESANCEYRY